MSSAKFWQEVFIAAIRNGQGYDGATIIADEATQRFKDRLWRTEIIHEVDAK